MQVQQRGWQGCRWVARFKETTLTNKGTVEGIDFYVRGLKHSSVPCPSRHQSHPYWITNDVLGSRGLAHHHLNISSTHHPSLPSTTPITSTYSGLSRRTEHIVVGRKPVDAQHRQGHHGVRPNFNHTPSRNGSPNVHPQHLGAPAVSLACQVPPPLRYRFLFSSPCGGGTAALAMPMQAHQKYYCCTLAASRRSSSQHASTNFQLSQSLSPATFF